MVDLVERLNALLNQERKVYHCKDYLSPQFQQSLSHADACTEIASGSTSSGSSTINEMWREKIIEWSYQVVDHFDFSREVVAISISFLDRYLCTCTVDKKLFQLAAMTTLYLAIKLNEPGKLSMSSMIELSRGYFMVDQMALMETTILQALSWHVHPPTPFCMARHFLHLIPINQTALANSRNDILELARFLTELSVIDYYFVPHKPSSVGLAALLNALEFIGLLPDDLIRQLGLLSTFDPYSQEVQDCRVRLYELYEHGGYSRPDELRSETVSPVCVTGFDSATEIMKPR